jgi:hypothetical protein
MQYPYLVYPFIGYQTKIILTTNFPRIANFFNDQRIVGIVILRVGWVSVTNNALQKSSLLFFDSFHLREGFREISPSSKANRIRERINRVRCPKLFGEADKRILGFSPHTLKAYSLQHNKTSQFIY